MNIGGVRFAWDFVTLLQHYSHDLRQTRYQRANILANKLSDRSGASEFLGWPEIFLARASLSFISSISGDSIRLVHMSQDEERTPLYFICFKCRTSHFLDDLDNLLVDEYEMASDDAIENSAYSVYDVSRDESLDEADTIANLNIKCRCGALLKAKFFARFIPTFDSESSARPYYLDSVIEKYIIDVENCSMEGLIGLFRGETIERALRRIIDRWNLARAKITIAIPFIDLHGWKILFGDAFAAKYSASMNPFDVNFILTRPEQTSQSLRELDRLSTEKKRPCSNPNQEAKCILYGGPCECEFYDSMADLVKPSRSSFHAKFIGARLNDEVCEVILTSFNLTFTERPQIQSFSFSQVTPSEYEERFLKPLNALL